jgi:transmembrane sensor
MNWELLIRYVNQESTDAENAEVIAWLDGKAENKFILKQLQAKRKKSAQPVKPEVVHAEWVKVLDRIFESPKTEEKPKNFRLLSLLSIAATLLVVCCITWYLAGTDKKNAPQAIIVKTTTERRQVQLPDGSVVYLAPNSGMVIAGNYAQKARELQITGEAFFNVKHNTARPFIVHTANNLKVNVLGTSFNIYSRKGGNEEVKVATGLVGLVTPKATVFIKAGEQADYIQANALVKKGLVNVHDAESLQNGILYFKNSNIDQIAAKITRYYNVQVSVEPSALKHPNFSGEMKDYGITKMLDGLSYATGIRYKIKSQNSILLY